ncbi:ankyrin repeat domain-containing protein [Myroides sp. N17-2]|uniref:ankyrin repeat domain-containing protein n=1 Tax=Myroides sp. N17-2 TaxID=2030799 RepID=UPI000EFC4956|nr:hypothetical protein [Myroides sp. N17-2]
MTIYELKEIVIQQDFDLLKVCLEEYDISENDKFGNNILHYYINYIHGLKSLPINFKEIIGLFLGLGLDVNARQSSGSFRRSPLHQSVVLNMRELFDYLIDNGADVYYVDFYGGNLLLGAVGSYKRDEVNNGYYITRLLELGVDPFLKCNSGESAYSLSKYEPFSESFTFFDYLEQKE